ncbi:MFS transporter, partial [Salmonella enterica subsp. enterica serovar Chester]
LAAVLLVLFVSNTCIFLFYKICFSLPLLGLLPIFFPDNRQKACF